MIQLSSPTRVTPPPWTVPRLIEVYSRMVLRSPISRRVGSPPYFLSWFASPTEQKWKMRLSRPIFVWPVITLCAPIVVPSPISTSPSMTVYGPTVTLAWSFARASTIAVGWIAWLTGLKGYGTQMNSDEHRKRKSIVNDRGDGCSVVNTQALPPFSVFICVHLCPMLASTQPLCLRQFFQKLADLVGPHLHVLVLHLDPHAVGAGKAVDAARLHELQHSPRIDRRLGHELHHDAARRGVDLLHAQRRALDAQLVALEQHPRRVGKRSEAVDELLGEALELVVAGAVGKALVDDEPLVDVAAIGFRQEGGRMQVHLRRDVERAREIGLLALLQRAHRVLEHLGVEREAHVVDAARLRLAEHLSGAADLEVVHREVEAGAQVLHHLDRLESLLRVRGERFLGRREEIRVGLVVRPADASAQLVQLRKAELVGAVDEDRVGGRHVDAGLDDRRAQQQVRALVVEVAHHALQLALAHLAVRDRDA